MTAAARRALRWSTALTGTAVLAGCGVAYAYAPHGGSGSEGGPLTVPQNGMTIGPLVPGGSGQMVTFTVRNDGRDQVKMGRVDVAVGGVGGTTWDAVPGCSAADFRTGPALIAYGPLDAGASREGTVTIRMLHSDRNQESCDGVQVPLFLTVK